MGRWRRIAAGYYERRRAAHVDAVQRVRQDDGDWWVWLIDGDGGHDLSRTRREATQALDGWINDNGGG